MRPSRDAALRHCEIPGIGLGACSAFVFARGTEYASHRFGREPASEQESGLAGTLGERLGLRAEAASPDRARALELGLLERRGVRLHQRLIESVRAQFVADRRRAVALGAPMDQRFGEALVGEQSCRDELIEHGLELLGALGMSRELARQFGAAMLAPRKKPQCACLQRYATPGAARAGVAGAACAVLAGTAACPLARRLQAAASSGAAPRAATPKCARTLFSISSDISGCSRRNSRALSLPWPMRSPP